MVVKVSDTYPGIVIGFSTQNFLKTMPVGVENLKEIIDFASADGYAFIELRDPVAELSLENCMVLANYAKERDIEVIYEIHKDLFNPGFREVFDRAVQNISAFGQPGIVRSILSWSEFAADQDKRGWTREEMDHMTALADSCATTAKEQGVQFILENIIEPWSGKGEELGLDNFFEETTGVGLQFDTANPFLSSCRGVADPAAVSGYLENFGNRWITTHLKCAAEDKFQPLLRDNPLPYEKVFELMAANGVVYAALELLGVDSMEECFENHRKSIRYLADKGIIELT